MASTSATLDASQLAGWFDAEVLDPLARLDYGPLFDQWRLLLAAAAQENIRGAHTPEGQPWPPIQGLRARQGQRGGTAQPLRDQGRLLASLTADGSDKTIDRRTPTSLEWGTSLEYADTHQEGMTIRPKTGRFLAIPLTPEAYRAGRARNFPRPLVFQRAGKHRGFLVERQGRKGKKGARTDLQYLLVEQVTIPRREFLGLSDDLLAELQETLADFVVSKMEG